MIHKKKVFSYNLRFYRDELGLTQKEVAERSGLSLRAYQNLESSDPNPTFESMLLLSEVFNVDASRLIHLGSTRIASDFDHFMKRFRESFDQFRFCVGIRTVDGLGLWGNQATETALGHQVNWPISMTKYFSSSPHAMSFLQAELEAERKGLSHPYLFPNFIDESRKAFFRVYPTLIFPPKGRAPAWTATLSLSGEEDSPSHYYAFTVRLLECIYGLELEVV